MELKEITSMLNRFDQKWFLDSGSLLGLIREGRFMEHDHDIDIGIVWQRGNTGFESFLTQMLQNGFRIARFYWGNQMYKCKVIPTDRQLDHILDFQFYKLKGDKYVCPQMVFKKDLPLCGKINKRIIRLKKSDIEFAQNNRTVQYYLKLIYSNLFIGKEISFQNKEKKNVLYDHYMWEIPDKYIRDITPYGDFKIFAAVGDYLAYRYGEWKIPVRKWNFTSDDNALKKSSFSDLCDYETI